MAFCHVVRLWSSQTTRLAGIPRTSSPFTMHVACRVTTSPPRFVVVILNSSNTQHLLTTLSLHTKTYMKTSTQVKLDTSATPHRATSPPHAKMGKTADCDSDAAQSNRSSSNAGAVKSGFKVWPSTTRASIWVIIGMLYSPSRLASPSSVGCPFDFAGRATCVNHRSTI